MKGEDPNQFSSSLTLIVEVVKGVHNQDAAETVIGKRKGFHLALHRGQPFSYCLPQHPCRVV
jgi:hypothetical protein